MTIAAPALALPLQDQKVAARSSRRPACALETLIDPQQILDAYTNEVHRLYYAVVDRAENKLEILPAEFFRQLVRQFPGEMSLSLIRERRSDRGFRLGFDSRRRVTEPVHRRGLFVSIPRRICISTRCCGASISGYASGVSDIFVGQSADDFKPRIGCYHRPRYIYLKATNRLFHASCAS